MEQLKVANGTMLNACPELEEQVRRAVHRLREVFVSGAVAVKSFWLAESMVSTVVMLQDWLQQMAALVSHMKKAA